MTAPRPLALITGGMRRVGAYIAMKLAREGYDLALSTHQECDVKPLLLDVLTETDTRWKAFVADLSEPAAAPMLLDQVAHEFGRTPDLLVNNAAIFGQDGWQDMDVSSLESQFRLNLFSPLLLSRALVAAAGESARPAIVHILDQRIVNPHGDQISYTLSKQALAASVRSMAAAFGGRARVNGVAPGLVISTPDYDAALESRLAGMMPLGALPDPAGVADAVHYLAHAGHVTGQILYVDGGAHLKSFERDFMYL
ncbi:SDR family oxidoreductase [Sphingorhabdus arenilitoris]|uniref:SDR family oxidoreductase n=1 Tax=Sphingorhabdus arenilitoris TaxID=1490041 RepID=A0ABV8RLA9_9SPHN